MGGKMWMGPEIVKVGLQIVTILVAVIGIGIAIHQLRLLYFTYRDLHDWNRRKAALDAVEKVVNELAEDTPLLEENFQIMVKSDEIPIEQVRQKCDTNPKVRTALHRRLNYLECLAIGVDQGVLDEMVIEKAFEPVYNRTVTQFKRYLEHRRNTGFADAWVILERLSLKWQDKKRSHAVRQPTGGGT